MSNLSAFVPLMANHAVLVVGDVILDEYVVGKAERISREAPIPILELVSRRYIPGGAANPSVNIVALGSRSSQIGIVGEDHASEMLRHAMEQHGIDTNSLVIRAGRPTTLKTRILAQMGLRFPQQIARVDTLSRDPIDRLGEMGVMRQVLRNLPDAEAVLISDYQNGLLTPDLVSLIRAEINNKLPIIVDAQSGLSKYGGCDIVKCNADDAQVFLHRSLENHDDFAKGATQLCRELELKQAMIITRGADGATIATADGTVEHCPAPHVSDVYDTVGAGDTWIAVLTLALIAGANIIDACTIANTASGIVVQHVGNYAPTPEELMDALDAEGI